MSRKTHHAGAIASAFLLIAALFGAAGSGASAHSEESFSGLPQDEAAAVAKPDEGLPRFVAEPVVQALPIEAAPQQAAPVADSLGDLVASLPDQAALSRDLQCLAEAIYFEARGEDLSGQLAVAQVIVNRSESPLFPGDYCGVVTQRAQFSFVRGGRIPAAPRETAAWQRASAIARIAHRALWESEAEDALFFHARSVRPRWARTKMARATIDSHVFYR